MLILAISGAHRKVGKTLLARMFSSRFGARVIKVGRGPDRGKAEVLVHDVNELLPVVNRLREECDFLVIESRRAREVLNVDLTIFIEGWERKCKSPPEGVDVIIRTGIDEDDLRSRLKGKQLPDGIFDTLMAFYQEYLKIRGEPGPGDLTGVVLAGGRSSRLGGGDKAFIEFRGKTLLERRVSYLAPLCREIVVVTNRPAEYRGKGPFDVVSDNEPGLGPLMGLFAGLQRSRTHWNFVTACDMPFFSRSLFDTLKERTDGFDAVVPRVDRFLEPLFSFYSRSCLKAIEQSLNDRRRRIASIFSHVNVNYLEEDEIRRCDSQMLSFLNINTPEELEKALTVSEGLN